MLVGDSLMLAVAVRNDSVTADILLAVDIKNNILHVDVTTR